MTNTGGNLDLRNRLVAFRHLHGSHSGENLADVFFRVLEELSVLDRVCLFCFSEQNLSNVNCCRWG